MFSRLLEHLKRRIAGDGASRERLTRARWDQLQTVLTESLDRAPEERSAFLDGACAGDPLLRREAESLLQVHASPGILDRPVADVIAPLVVSRIGAEDSTDRIVSHYQVLEKLGSGGMGIVHRAHDLRLGRIVALKFLPPFLSDDERYKERFLAEAQMAAAFDHPNVCTIHEVGETEDGRLFIAMPYYDGETLKQRIAAGPLAIDEALHFGIQAAHGLSKAHERGIVHRDIKPANLMLTSDGVIKIVDFGIAKFSAVTRTHADATPGTVAYMSPEQAGGQSVDERTDIWSLGVVLYEMLAGQRPFKGAHDQVLLRAILGQEPVHLSELRPGMSHDVASAVHRALAKEPSERYDSIRSLALELERLRVGGRVRPAGASTTNGGARGEGNGPSSAARSSGALEGGQGLLPDGERRQATIVVACVSGYADLAEHLAPDARGRLLGEIRNDAAAIAVRYGGTLNSFGDDHMVLVFGIPTTHEDDCLRATRAALDLHERMRERSAGLDAHTAEAIRLHTGIDTGLVSAHSTDGEDPVYRIAGASTQAAAQLAALAATDEIWITPESQRLIAAFVETEAREALTLRGRETPVIPHHVLSASGRQSRLEAADLVGLTTYTGRETELAILTHCLGLAVRGDGQFATVTGEAGMGKSRLLHEFRQTHEGDKVIVLQGRCQSYGGNIAYLPFIETLRGILGLGHGDSSGTASAELLARVREIGPELEEFIPLYLHLLSIPHESYPVPKHLHGEQFRVAMQEALAAILMLGARRRPTIIFLEDWHWVDEASHAVLRQLLEMLPGCALLVVVTTRPQSDALWGAPAGLTDIKLGPLGEASCVAMLKSMLLADSLPVELATRLHERTGGNPFFLEEICQILLEEGTLRVERGAVLLTGAPDALKLPDTVQAVIRTRLDHLDRDARETLRLASVIGREFSRAILGHTVPSLDRLPGALDRLRGAGLIRQLRVVPDAAYRFKHVLTQEVAYAGLLEHQRKEMHGRVGHAIEVLHGDRLEEHFDRLVHHFSRAEAWTKAVRYGLRAAKRAWTLSQFPESLQTLERTHGWLSKLPDDAERRDILIKIRLRQERLCETLGLRGRQQGIIDELISLLESSDDAVRLAEAYLRQGDLYTLLRRYDDAEQALNRSLALRRELQDAVGERHTLRSLGLLRWHQDRNREALAYIERAVEIDRERADMEALVGDLSNLGYVLKGMGEHEGARAYLEEGLALSETIQRGENGGGGGAIAGEVAVQRSYLLHNLANVHRELGDDERALEFMLRAQDFARERRLPIQLSYHLTSIAHLHLRHGRVQESLEYYQEAVDLTRRARYASGLAQSLSFLGELMLGLERQAEALPHLLEAAALFGQLRDSASEATMWSRVAGVHEGRNDFAEALAAWGRARSLRQQSGDMAGALEALEGIARATRRHVAEPSLALGYYYEALAMADALADRKTQARLGNTIGILEWSRGAFDVALAQYDRALSLFQVLGDKAGAGLMMNSIGLTLAALGRLDDARMRLEKAITLHHSSGERLLEGHALAALGDVCERMGETSVAQERYEHSLRIRREIGDRRGEGWMLHRLARIHLSLGALGLGRELAARASEAATECSDQELSDACDRLLREPTL